MEIWLLVFWSLKVEPFVGGHYQTRELCVAAAQQQLPYFRKRHGALWWSCDERLE